MSTQVTEVAGPRNGITVQKIEAEVNKSPLQVLTSPKSYSGKSKIVIEGFDFRKLDVADQKQCAVTDCQDVVVRRCIFGNKTTKGQGLNITGARTKRVTVEYCIFENMTFSGSNGGEPSRLGNSQFSGCVFDSTIRNCIFRNLNADVEAISIKSCKDIIEDNFFINNKSNVTVRHGGLATVRHNYFENLGGVRLHGYGNVVEYNCFNNIQVTDKFGPITVRYGTEPKDPNFIDVKTPSGKEGQSHSVYAQTVDAVIRNNEFLNCAKTVYDLADGKPLPPKGTINENNKKVTGFSFNKGVVQEPEQPEITPIDPQDPLAQYTCGIHRHAPATNHLHIYTCPEHAEVLRPKFKKILEETEAEAAAAK